MKIKGQRSLQSKLDRLALELADDANRVVEMNNHSIDSRIVDRIRLIANDLQSLSMLIEETIE